MVRINTTCSHHMGNISSKTKGFEHYTSFKATIYALGFDYCNSAYLHSILARTNVMRYKECTCINCIAYVLEITKPHKHN